MKTEPSLSEGSLPHVSTYVSRVFFLQSGSSLNMDPALRTQSTFPLMNIYFLKYGQVALQLSVNTEFFELIENVSSPLTTEVPSLVVLV